MQIAFEHLAKENEKKLIRTTWIEKSQRGKKKVSLFQLALHTPQRVK